MSQKNDTPVLLLSLLITVGLLGAGAWWFSSRLNLGDVISATGQSTTPGGASDAQVNPASSVAERFSTGERLLITEGSSAAKQAGVQAIANGDFTQAITNLEAALQASPNDPEALIYLNNARIGTGNAYTLAAAVPTATATNSALEILRGVAQAQHEVNQAGGINGVPLKVMIASDDNDPDIAPDVANALVNDATVLGVVGHFGSDATLAAAPVYQQGQLVMVSPTSTSMALSEVGDYIFRTVPSDRFTATTLSRYMVNTLSQQNAAVFFNSQSQYSQSLKDEFTTATYGDGGQVVAEFDLSVAGFDAAASIEQAIAQEAQVLVLLPNTATLDQALQVVVVNRGRLPLIAGDSVYNPKTLQIGGANAVDMVVGVPWDLLAAAQTLFGQASRQLWKGDVNWRTAMSYDATQVLIAGLRANPTRSGMNETLSNANFSVDGATGNIRFLPSGDRNQAVQLVVVKPGDRSGYGYDFDSAPR